MTTVKDILQALTEPIAPPDINPALRTCRDCFWWKPVAGMQRDGLPIGECRVKSPQTFQRNDERATVVTRWPLTVSLDFCGMQRPVRREQGGAQ